MLFTSTEYRLKRAHCQSRKHTFAPLFNKQSLEMNFEEMNFDKD